LIIIDGGKGQLSGAKSIDDLGLRGKIAIIRYERARKVILSWNSVSFIFR
jgi:excinuclease UvrABC nuclease subunit